SWFMAERAGFRLQASGFRYFSRSFRPTLEAVPGAWSQESGAGILRARPSWCCRVDLHLVAVLQIADGVERAGDDLVAGLQAGEHFEVLVAGDARLDRDEGRVAVREDEDAFGLFLRLAWWKLLGGGRARAG